MASQPSPPLDVLAGESPSLFTRGHWRPSEDEKLKQLVAHHGPQNWNLIAQHLHGRSGKSCRLRWFNQLDPRINRAAFTTEEEERLVAAHRLYGNKWACIARLFPGRTDNAVKNHWHVIMARHSRQQQQQEEHGAAAKRNSSYLSASRCSMQFSSPSSHSQTSATQQSGQGKIIGRNEEQLWLPLMHNRQQDGDRLHRTRRKMERIDQTCKSWHLCNNQLSNKPTSQYIFYQQRGLKSNANIEDFEQGSTQNLTKEVPFIDFLGVGRV